MVLTKTFLVAAAIAAGPLFSPPAAAAPRRIPEPPSWSVPRAQPSERTAIHHPCGVPNITFCVVNGRFLGCAPSFGTPQGARSRSAPRSSTFDAARRGVLGCSDDGGCDEGAR
jgi:hypothetical protein